MSDVTETHSEERWNRLLWGVHFFSSLDKAPVLIGVLWAMDMLGTPYPGEPTRALLFNTRKHARDWCADTMRKWQSGQQPGDILMRWRVRPVRVRETVQVEEAKA
jgi:hypothetical protein